MRILFISTVNHEAYNFSENGEVSESKFKLEHFELFNFSSIISWCVWKKYGVWWLFENFSDYIFKLLTLNLHY